MKPNPKPPTEDTLADATAALLRAAQRARVVARRTGTPLVISKDGRVEKRWLETEAVAGRRDDFEKHLAAVPDKAPPEFDRLD